jgi:hypothetical protein
LVAPHEVLPVLIGQFQLFNTNTCLSKLPKHQSEASIPTIMKPEKRSSSHLSMPQKRDILKAMNLRHTKSKAKLIEWETRVYSRGTRDVPVEVSTAASQQKPTKKAGRGPRAERNDPLQGEAAPQPMDVDETFWVEEPVVPASEKGVRKPVCPSSMNLTYLLVPAQLH